MPKKIFISYSRRELGFADDLVGNLEEKKYDVWLDYRVLIPGSPWADQIDKGLRESDTVLLVVSKASLASEYVELEWRHFLETNKRVILCLFEAVNIPTELEKYEWVDFRGNYQAGLKELFSQLEKPAQEEHPVPESGFKVSGVVWATAALSVVVAIISLGAFWTIFIPFFLIPLPYQIFKRNFDFMRVQASLLAMPFALALTYIVYFGPGTLVGQLLVPNPKVFGGLNELSIGQVAVTDWITGLYAGFVFGFLGLILLFVLRSPAMLRWGKPEATPPKFKNPYMPNIANPEPTPFFVEHAPEDRVVANEMKNVLEKYGHPEVENIHDAKAVLVIVSRFNADTQASLDKQIVFPVMVQGNNNIASSLSRVQWVDFRPGVRGLDAIAQLLPNPRDLLKTLGMRPVSSLSVYPPMITAMYYFIILITVLFFGAVAHYIFFSDALTYLDGSFYTTTLAELIFGVVLICGLAYWMVTGLLNRTGLFSRFFMIIVGLLVQGLLMIELSRLDKEIAEAVIEAGEDINFTFAYFGDILFGIGLIVLLLIFLRNRLDINRWFPTRSK